MSLLLVGYCHVVALSYKGMKTQEIIICTVFCRYEKYLSRLLEKHITCSGIEQKSKFNIFSNLVVGV